MTTYSAEHLAVFSTILTGATRATSWVTLGKINKTTQEEIQMMQVDGKIYIACNQAGHQHVKDFLNRWAVRDETSFIEALRWSYIIMHSSPQTRKWLHNSQTKSNFSNQEYITLNAFTFPTTLSSVIGDDDVTAVFNCVGKVQKRKPKPTNPNDWKTGRFQQLLGLDDKKKNYNKNADSPDDAADFAERGLNTGPSDKDVAVITYNGAKVHAEIKLLAYLTKQVVENRVTGDTIPVGGLKAACKKCAKWLTPYVTWLHDTHGKDLVIPQNDNRSSAGPTNWSKPNAPSISDESAIEDISDLFL